MPVKKSGGQFEIKNPRREEAVKVERKSASGVFGNGKWYNVSKFKPELLESVESGNTYMLTISTSTTKDGKTFDNVVAVTPVEVEEKPIEEKSPEKAAGFKPIKEVFKGRDFDAEARGKTRCAIFAAAVTGLAKSVEEAIEIAEAGVAFSFGDKMTKKEEIEEEVEFPE